MKPEGPVARREDYLVLPCPHATAKKLVEKHHYSRAAANTSVHSHCLVQRATGRIVGAALWMPPTATAAKARAKAALGTPERHREVLVLSRLVVAPGEPKNAAGILLGASEKLVRRDPRWSLLVTYADQGEGHTGTIYRATNWQPTGVTRPEPRWVNAQGQMCSRLATSSRTVAQMEQAGCTRALTSSKIRFEKKVRP